jgi:hypothetical protein
VGEGGALIGGALIVRDHWTSVGEPVFRGRKFSVVASLREIALPIVVFSCLTPMAWGICGISLNICS